MSPGTWLAPFIANETDQYDLGRIIAIDGATHIKVTLIHNPEAGEDGQPSRERLLRLIRGAGHKARYQSSKENKWTKALKKPCDIVAVAGGDGTVGKVARRLIGRRTPIAVLPMGIANNVANTLGLSGKTFEELIDGWQAARCVNFDAGLAKGPWGTRYFIEGFGIGLFAETMFRIDNGKQPDPSRSNDPEEEINAALKVLKKQLSNYPPKRMTVRLDGRDRSGEYFLLEAMNVRFIGPKLDFVPRAETNDGLLDVVFVSKEERAKLSQYISDPVKRQRSPVSLTVRRGRHLQVEWQSSPVHIDDRAWPEGVLANAVDIKTDAGALVFLAP
jgi:diacylglycerol kinase (ATP)